MLLYTDPLKDMLQYLTWFRQGCDYTQIQNYHSAGLNIRKGNVIRKKNTVVDADGVANLTPYDVDKPVKEKYNGPLPRKIRGSIEGVPIVVSAPEVFDTCEAFMTRFPGLQYDLNKNNLHRCISS